MRVYLLGQHIQYSASPAMQTAGFRAAGLDGWSYELLDVPAESVPDAVGRLRDPGVAGANVTIPHKLAVLELCDDVEPQARAVGAVNTVVNDGGTLRGSNTDIGAIRGALTEVGVQPGPHVRALILGGGGSARAAGAALEGSRIVFALRRPAHPELPGDVVDWGERDALARDADVLINATPLGRSGEEPVAPANLPRAGAVIDLVYTPAGTPLQRAARDAGLRTVDGWSVLLAQGAASFKAWTGVEAPIDEMRAALGS
ncbi:MAG TPA: shikimate dehydrogenase [Candidatus Dormibacteraeota bacterium]